MLVIRRFSVPSALLIAISAGAIVVDIAAPMRLIAATRGAQSMPNCALTGWDAMSDRMRTSTRSLVRCSQNACKNCHLGFIRSSLLE